MKHIKSYDDYLLESDSAKAIEDRINKIAEVKDKKDAVKKGLEDGADEKGSDEPKPAAAVDGGDDDKSKELDKSKKEASSEKPTEPARQGYDDREDESLGDRTGKESDKKQSDKDRREDSYGKWGKRDKKTNESTESIDEMQEDHEKYDSRLTSMPLGKVLGFLKTKDPVGYKDIEKYLETNFKDMTTTDEDNFFTGMTS